MTESLLKNNWIVGKQCKANSEETNTISKTRLHKEKKPRITEEMIKKTTRVNKVVDINEHNRRKRTFVDDFVALQTVQDSW